MNIGFVGLGIMGKPMAMNLLKAGHRLNIFTTNEETLNEFRQKGAVITISPKELGRVSDVVITMLPDSPQVREVALDEEGLFYGLGPAKLFIDMSTIDVATVLEIHEKFRTLGVETLDAPVSGGEVGAVSASLSIMAGGSTEAFARVLPIFQVLGKKISHMGAIGAGQITKSCSQIATALATQGVIEAFTLAKSAGVDVAKVREALLGGFAESRVLSLTGERMIRRDFKPGFKVELYRKDLRIALSAAKERALFLPGAELMSGEMEQLLQAGKGDLDFSALIQVMEK
ncbi:MAG TPA: NAD(P)-dependent oxidoreductase [Puia sp.]|jgi:2-hydroxy-3-oxopropionate reductase